MAVSYYVYYRISPARHAVARQAVAAMFRELRDTQAIHGRLACRRDDPDTWMEIYEGVGDTQVFDDALNQAVRNCGIDACLEPDAARATEIFVTMDADGENADRNGAQ